MAVNKNAVFGGALALGLGTLVVVALNSKKLPEPVNDQTTGTNNDHQVGSSYIPPGTVATPPIIAIPTTPPAPTSAPVTPATNQNAPAAPAIPPTATVSSSPLAGYTTASGQQIVSSTGTWLVNPDTLSDADYLALLIASGQYTPAEAAIMVKIRDTAAANQKTATQLVGTIQSGKVPPASVVQTYHKNTNTTDQLGLQFTILQQQGEPVGDQNPQTAQYVLSLLQANSNLTQNDITQNLQLGIITAQYGANGQLIGYNFANGTPVTPANVGQLASMTYIAGTDASGNTSILNVPAGYNFNTFTGQMVASSSLTPSEAVSEAMATGGYTAAQAAGAYWVYDSYGNASLVVPNAGEIPSSDQTTTNPVPPTVGSSSPATTNVPEPGPTPGGDNTSTSTTTTQTTPSTPAPAPPTVVSVQENFDSDGNDLGTTTTYYSDGSSVISSRLAARARNRYNQFNKVKLG